MPPTKSFIILYCKPEDVVVKADNIWSAMESFFYLVPANQNYLYKIDYKKIECVSFKYYFISTSNTSGAFGGIEPPAPLAP